MPAVQEQARLQTPAFVRRLGPVLRPHDCPFPCTLAFNAGVLALPPGVGGRYAGKHVMVFRNDAGAFGQPEGWPGGGGVQRTSLHLAVSDDGLRWRVEDRELWHQEPGIYLADGDFLRRYDPRLTLVDGFIHLTFAVDTAHGTLAGLAVTDDLVAFEELGHTSPTDRNHVLFPERIGGKLVRLGRPFHQYGNRRSGDAFDIWISESPDGRHWGDHRLLLGREAYPWVNDKIGPGAPPIRTEAGWLCLTHAVDRVETPLPAWDASGWNKRYTASLMLLDLEAPWRVLGIARRPLLVPEEPYETRGFRGHVIFPGGLLDLGNGTLRIYYGAADTVEAAAEADTADLLGMIEPV